MIFFKKRKMKKALRKALADGELTREEAEELGEIADRLGVSDEFINDFRLKHYKDQVKPILDRVLVSRRMSPDDEHALLEIGQKLQITPRLDDDLLTCRRLWQIENTKTFQPQPIEVPLRLAKNEECYHWCPAAWSQVKTIRENTGYVGGSVGFRVAKGVTLRLGRAVPTYRTHESAVPISDGNFYVTNKKLVFMGTRRSTNVTYGRLAHYELYRDGLEVFKTSGKPDIFEMTPMHVEYVDALLQVIG